MVRAARCATDHGLSLFSNGFPYIFTATPTGWRGRPAFSLPRRLITFPAKQFTTDCGSLIPGWFTADDIAETPEPSRASVNGLKPAGP